MLTTAPGVFDWPMRVGLSTLQDMRYADWKNDFTFDKLFGRHHDVLRDLLNDLMCLQGAHAIHSLEYLPRDQSPQLPGGRRAIVDVKCHEVSGRVFLVEMQLFSHTGFVDRVVYNACRALVSQLAAGEGWRELADVVAVAICNFEIWSDSKQAQRGEPPVPLISRWQMTEEHSGVQGLGQLRYLFLELPKLGDKKPETAAETWAWLFRKAASLDVAPEQIQDPPLTPTQRKALSLANIASFTEQERETYERVRQELWISAGIADQAKAEGLVEGLMRGKRESLLKALGMRGFHLTEAQRSRVDTCIDIAQLEAWFECALTASKSKDLDI